MRSNVEFLNLTRTQNSVSLHFYLQNLTINYIDVGYLLNKTHKII